MVGSSTTSTTADVELTRGAINIDTENYSAKPTDLVANNETSVNNEVA